MSQTPLTTAWRDRRGLRIVKAAGRPGRQAPRPLGNLRLVGPQSDCAPRKSILIAYHGRVTRRTLAALLLREGHCVTCCDDGDAAVRHLRSSRVDLVITGLVMRNTDGLELIHRLRGQNASLPVIALADETDRMSPVYLHYAVLSGAVSTHTIPLDPEAFLLELKLILRERKPVIRDAVW